MAIKRTAKDAFGTLIIDKKKKKVAHTSRRTFKIPKTRSDRLNLWICICDKCAKLYQVKIKPTFDQVQNVTIHCGLCAKCTV